MHDACRSSRNRGRPMPERQAVEEPAPPRTDRPLRQVVVYLGIAYAIPLAIALALPRAGLAPLISIAVPVAAAALTTALVVPRGQRRPVWGRSVSIRVGGEGCSSPFWDRWPSSPSVSASRLRS